MTNFVYTKRIPRVINDVLKMSEVISQDDDKVALEDLLQCIGPEFFIWVVSIQPFSHYRDAVVDSAILNARNLLYLIEPYIKPDFSAVKNYINSDRLLSDKGQTSPTLEQACLSGMLDREKTKLLEKASTSLDLSIMAACRAVIVIHELVSLESVSSDIIDVTNTCLAIEFSLGSEPEAVVKQVVEERLNVLALNIIEYLKDYQGQTIQLIGENKPVFRC